MKIYFYILCLILLLLLSNCSNQAEIDAAKVTENYIVALAEKKKPEIISLSCKEWEESAVLEVDALLSVDASLSGLNCEVIGKEENNTLVKCSGSLDLTYNDEVRSLDLSHGVYKLRKEDGQLRVCSYE